MSSYPVICLVGKSGSGKTTVIEYILQYCQTIDIVTTKFTHKNRLDLNPKGKDNRRHMEAGAVANFSFAKQETFISIKREKREDLDDIFTYLSSLKTNLPDIDLVLIESFNNPPESIPVILTGIETDDLEYFASKVTIDQIIAVSGKIGSELDSYMDIPVINVHETSDLDRLRSIINNYLGEFDTR